MARGVRNSQVLPATNMIGAGTTSTRRKTRRRRTVNRSSAGGGGANSGTTPIVQVMTPEQRKFYNLGVRHTHDLLGIRGS